MAAEAHVFLPQRKPVPFGDADLLLDDVDTGHAFGHRVLDLDPGVHLHEVELARRGIDDAFDRACIAVADVPAEADRSLAHARAQALREPRRRALLDQLLIAPLRRAVALAQVQHLLRVGQDLDFDMADVRQVLLDVHRAVAERRLRLARCRFEVRGEVGLALDDAHAAPAAAGHRLQDDRIAEGGSNLRGGARRGHGAARPRRHRHPGLDRHRPRRSLVAHQRNHAPGRADEADAVLLAQVGERGILGKEAVARVDGIGLQGLRHMDHQLGTQIALARRRRTDAHRLVGELDRE